MKKTSINTRLILTAVVAFGLLPLSADTIVIEGDLEVKATGNADGNLSVDNELTVNPSSSGATFKVEENGSVWAGEDVEYDETLKIANGGTFFAWESESGNLRAMYSVPSSDVSYGNVASVAFGIAEVYGSYSFGAGKAQVYGNYSAGWGDYADPVGDYSTAWGSATTAMGRYSTVWGDGTFAFADNSTAFGEYTLAYGNASVVWGLMTHANSKGSTVFGGYNSGIETESDSSSVWYDLDSLLEIGYGTSEADRGNAITVLKNGLTTLNNKFWDSESPLTVPQDTDLVLDGDQTSAGGALVVEGHAQFQGRVVLAQPQGDISMGAFAN
ncbi:hypothetical protein [Cerasicoccus fimbriatus]|uniref:hypothetical protein n=1 Tax=Cerasicoccus fimbriatus TaxID=3014554 RepID=UPI0022B3A634|nr:hypothetical protein [Cerasicoccus sp. TK19100]